VKLCTLTQSYAPNGGGVRTFIHAQREWCRDRGIEHVLIVPGDADTVTRAGVLTTHTIRSPFVPGSTVYRLLLRSRAVLRILRAELPDVIELHDAYNLPWAALLHRRRHGGVVSAFYMTDLPVAYVETPLRARTGAPIARAARRAAESYLRALYARCDRVVAISPAMRDRLHAIGVAAAVCVPLGVDLETFSPARRSDDVRARHGARPQDLVLVYAGRLDSEKRPDIVLDAFERLPHDFGARLILAGDGPLRRTLARRVMSDTRVRVLPFVHDRAELAALLASADIYVSAMAHETFGLSVVEAQACGLPVVGVRAGAMTDRVHDGIGFLVEPGSPDAIANRILNTPRDEWAHMGCRARAYVEHEFSWDRTFEALLALYGTHRNAAAALTGPLQRPLAH
jgi:alpha-1,6-mannosyltransferase